MGSERGASGRSDHRVTDRTCLRRTARRRPHLHHGRHHRGWERPSALHHRTADSRAPRRRFDGRWTARRAASGLCRRSPRRARLRPHRREHRGQGHTPADQLAIAARTEPPRPSQHLRERNSVVLFQSITDARAALRAGTITATALVAECISKADEDDKELGVFVTRFNAAALTSAAETDDRIRRGDRIRPLDGIPIGIKDIIADPGGATTAQSLVRDAACLQRLREAAATRRLRAAGAIIVGKTTTQEFAIGLPDPAKPYP
ncbi:hypothetical protein EEB14_13005, partial [Rhodococcus sp. WS4]